MADNDLEARRRKNGEFGNKTQTEATDGTVKAPTAPANLLEGFDNDQFGDWFDRTSAAYWAAQTAFEKATAAAIAVTVLNRFPDARFVDLDDEDGSFGALNIVDEHGEDVYNPEQDLDQTLADIAVDLSYLPTSGGDWIVGEPGDDERQFDLAAALHGAVGVAKPVVRVEDLAFPDDPQETIVDLSNPDFPRAVLREHIEADRDHDAEAGEYDETVCWQCELSITGDGRHGYDA